ncbi:hypothetical protein AVEN_186474-1 [Araneus ventricosus]|uniref:Myosin motor domain-containing protein n=1 Tax=Araneus ventricosus TaxID=182803 RepID=A0A4Y2UPT7_ARAVE|nr:hypothetical protein AVEN_13611-1 [Araneus ventricosus]GBO15016.1 hypothetical protein AVEN_186474-1 [Araneus ventricosus]
MRHKFVIPISRRIQTYIGNVVVSVNPYKKLALYTTEVIHAYQRYSMYELPPHIPGTKPSSAEAGVLMAINSHNPTTTAGGTHYHR